MKQFKLGLAALLAFSCSLAFGDQQTANVTAVSTGTSNMSVITLNSSGNIFQDDPEGESPRLVQDFENNSILTASSLGQSASINEQENLVLISTETMVPGSSRMVKGTFNDAANIESLTMGYNIAVSTIVMFGVRKFTAALSDNQKVWRYNQTSGGTWDYVMSSFDGGGSFNECNNFDFYHGFDYQVNVPLKQWFLWSHGSDYRSSCAGDGSGDGMFLNLTNGATTQYLTNRCNCNRIGAKLQLFDNFAGAPETSQVDGASVYQDNFVVWSSFFRVTASSDNFVNQVPVIHSAWSSGQIVGRVMTVDIANGTPIQVRVWGGQNQVLAQSSVTTGAGQTNVSPFFSGATSSSATFKWTGVGSNNYNAVFCGDSNCATVISSASVSTVERTITGLNPGTTYYAKVKVSTESDNSYTQVSTLTYNSRLAVSTSNVNSGGATINWNTVGDMLLVIATDKTFGSIVSSSTVSSAGSATASGLSSQTSYAYKVKFSSDGDGGYNVDGFTTTQAVANPVAAPPAGISNGLMNGPGIFKIGR